MRVLVLGGTRFLGRAVVAAALAAGDDVTTFTRGVSGKPPDPVEALYGNRGVPSDLGVLKGRQFDVIVDTSGYEPRVVRDSARLLAPSAGHYVFVSTLNVFPGWPERPVGADSPVHDGTPDAVTGDAPDDPVARYGWLKAGCERAVEREFGDRSTMARAGLLIGPHDDTGRLTWWLRRVARGGEVLAPGRPDRRMALADVRDLATWMLRCGRDGVAGSFITTGPAGQVSFEGLLDACRTATGSDGRFSWLPDDFLTAHEVTPWTDLPLWLPEAIGPAAFDHDTGPAEQAGLRFRPVARSVAETWAWLRTTPDPAHDSERPSTGIDPEKEQAVLDAWHAAGGSADGSQV
jgi:2'-hydroxyisoflavone reductase